MDELEGLVKLLGMLFAENDKTGFLKELLPASNKEAVVDLFIDNGFIYHQATP